LNKDLFEKQGFDTGEGLGCWRNASMLEQGFYAGERL
jgi:hypothetical protein